MNPAPRSVDAAGGNEWWSRGREFGGSLRQTFGVLAYSDTDFQMTTLYGWGQQARALLDGVALAWDEVPKAVPDEG